MELNDLERVLAGLVSELKPAPTVPDEAPEYERIDLDRTEKDNSRWLAYMSEALKTAATFEIHCWNEETEWIALALRYGRLKNADWRYGKIIVGEVTPEFIMWIAGLPKPSDTEIYNKMTPFFTVSLDNGFSSSHYGTEITKQQFTLQETR